MPLTLEENRRLQRLVRRDLAEARPGAVLIHPPGAVRSLRLPSGAVLEPPSPAESGTLALPRKSIVWRHFFLTPAGAANQRTQVHPAAVTGPALLLDMWVSSNGAWEQNMKLLLRVAEDDGGDDATSFSVAGTVVSGDLVNDAIMATNVTVTDAEVGGWRESLVASPSQSTIVPLGYFVPKRTFFVKVTSFRAVTPDLSVHVRILQGATPDDVGF